MNQGFPDTDGIKVDEHVVLQKFDGEVEDGKLVERLTVHNGKLVLHEFIEDGEVVRTINPTERSD